MNELIELWIKVTKERELEELPKEINDLYDYTVKLQQENNRLKSEKIGLERLCNHNYLVAEDLEKEKQDFIKWLESKNQFHYKNGKIEDNYILVSEVLNKVRGD